MRYSFSFVCRVANVVRCMCVWKWAGYVTATLTYYTLVKSIVSFFVPQEWKPQFTISKKLTSCSFRCYTPCVTSTQLVSTPATSTRCGLKLEMSSCCFCQIVTWVANRFAFSMTRKLLVQKRGNSWWQHRIMASNHSLCNEVWNIRKASQTSCVPRTNYIAWHAWAFRSDSSIDCEYLRNHARRFMSPYAFVVLK